MNLLDNVFIKKAIKSVMSQKQFEAIQNFMTAVQSGKIDKEKLKEVTDKLSKLTPEEINNILYVVDNYLK